MKKALSLLLVLIMLLLTLGMFTSCGGSSEPSVKLIDIPLTEEEYAFVVKKGNTALKNDYNSFLSEITKNGKFQEIVDKYFKGIGEKKGQPVGSNDAINDENTFVVATNCPFEPFEYLGEDGLVYGLDIEIAALYAESRGLNLVIKNIPVFESIFMQVDSEYADIGMAGITINAKRKNLYDFTDTYYNASQKLIVSIDNTDFDNCTSAEDVEAVLATLEGKKFGFQTGTTGGMYIVGDEDWGFDGFANIEGKQYSTALIATTDLANGNLYAVIVDEAPGQAIVNSFDDTSIGNKLDVFFSTLNSKYFSDLLWQGIRNTIIIAIVGLVMGIVIGLLIASVKVSPKKNIAIRILDKICSIYVTIFRGTPMVVQLLLAYYVLIPGLLGIKGVSELTVGIIVFGMNSGAYVSEIMRGGLNSVDIGQTEAGRALGLGYGKTMIRIVIPQAVKHTIPTLGNEFITLVKETSVLSFISVVDIKSAIDQISTPGYSQMGGYIVLALIYIVMICAISLLVKLVEHLLSKSDRRKGGKGKVLKR